MGKMSDILAAVAVMDAGYVDPETNVVKRSNKTVAEDVGLKPTGQLKEKIEIAAKDRVKMNEENSSITDAYREMLGLDPAESKAVEETEILEVQKSNDEDAMMDFIVGKINKKRINL